MALIGRERFETSIKNAIVNKNALTQADRARIYESAREITRSHRSYTAETGLIVDAAISSIEKTFAGPIPSKAVQSYRQVLLLVAPLVVGIVLGATYTHLVTPAEPEDPRLAKIGRLVEAYYDNVAQVPVAIGFINEVVDEIKKRQKDNLVSLKAISKKMSPLSKLDPDLNERLHSSLSDQTEVVVRADADNLKVLMNWPLCGLIRVSNPDMVDPVRGPAQTIGCPYFGVWTSGAKKW